MLESARSGGPTLTPVLEPRMPVTTTAWTTRRTAACHRGACTAAQTVGPLHELAAAAVQDSIPSIQAQVEFALVHMHQRSMTQYGAV